VYVDQITADVVAVTRHCPITHQSVILVAHTAFGHPSGHCVDIKPLVLDGLVDKVILKTYLTHKSYQQNGKESVTWRPPITTRIRPASADRMTTSAI